jgi:small subunit ribosomal protein S21
MAEAFKRNKEDIEKMLKRFKRQVKNERIIDTVRSHEHYEKPSEVRKRNDEIARRRQWTKQKEDEL